MPDATYYVAMPFVAADGGAAAGEAVELHGQRRRSRGPKHWRARKTTLAPLRSVAAVIPRQAKSVTPSCCDRSAKCRAIPLPGTEARWCGREDSNLHELPH